MCTATSGRSRRRRSRRSSWTAVRRSSRPPGSETEIPCELVLLAMGFVGPEREGLLTELGVDLDERGNVSRDASWQASQEGVFVCGDMGRGQSLIVWAIAEGRARAASVDRYLVGDTALPEPVVPTSMPLR